VFFKQPMNAAAEQVISKLGLAPLPHEGGYFRAAWTSATLLPSGRPAASAIFFLMTAEGFSALHRFGAEELWHFLSGDAVEHVQLDPHDGRVSVARLGSDVLAGDASVLRVGKNIWQGARLASGGRQGWALLGCTVSPAWDQAEFELGNAAALRLAFPGNDALVRKLTR
jgi:uncharacterized protein